MKIKQRVIQIGLEVLLGLGQSLAWAVDGPVEYRVEQMVPKLAQLRYFNNPIGIAVAPDGSVWVADTENHRIQHFKADGALIAVVGTEGTKAGQFWSPRGIAVAPDGSVWVADTFNNRLQHLNAAGITIALVGSYGSALGQFYSPSGIAIGTDGSIWVMETTNQRVQHLSAKGVPISKFGSEGSAPGQFTYPFGIAVAADGSIWVADRQNDRVQHLSAVGVSIAQFGSYGSGQFNHPDGIAVATDGSIWVADTGNHRVQHLSVEGLPLGSFGSKGSSLSQFTFPSGIAIDADGGVWVLDDRILKFTPHPTDLNQPADYDDKNELLYLRDVEAGGSHYNATLQYQNNQYHLLTLNPSLASYTPAASFNAADNLLTLPLAKAFGQDYAAVFKLVKKDTFELLSATVKSSPTH